MDRVRPEDVSFQKLMKQRLTKHMSHTSPSTAASSLKANDALVSAAEPLKWDEKKEMQHANVLYSLLEDRFVKEFPLPKTLRRPASHPEYYDELVKEMQEAPTRSWLGGLIKRIKGSLRFS